MASLDYGWMERWMALSQSHMHTCAYTHGHTHTHTHTHTWSSRRSSRGTWALVPTLPLNPGPLLICKGDGRTSHFLIPSQRTPGAAGASPLCLFPSPSLNPCFSRALLGSPRTSLRVFRPGGGSMHSGSVWGQGCFHGYFSSSINTTSG